MRTLWPATSSTCSAALGMPGTVAVAPVRPPGLLLRVDDPIDGERAGDPDDLDVVDGDKFTAAEVEDLGFVRQVGVHRERAQPGGAGGPDVEQDGAAFDVFGALVDV